MFRTPALLILALALAACQDGVSQPGVQRAASAAAPMAATAPEGACWATDRVPAVTETVFEAAAPGAVRQPREVVIRAAEDRLFAVPCAEQTGGDFIANVQRALAVRGHYSGAITGVWSTETADAVRRFQAPQGLNSGILSLQAAQQLGLIAVSRGG